MQGAEVHTQRGKHLVLPHSRCPTRRPQPVRQPLQQAGDEIFDRVREAEGEGQPCLLLALADGEEPLHGLADPLVLPRSLPAEDLVGEHPQGPPVHRHVVGVREVNHLRGHVVRRAHPRVCLPKDKARETHVPQLGIAPGIEQDVLGLHIPVNDPPLVHVFQCGSEAGSIEGRSVAVRLVLRQHLWIHVEHLEEVAPQGCLEQEVHVLLVPERLVQGDDEGAL
mmetsp:Transcript_111267/g.309866  ORF Transcript_111267/g.309866 Transcript_111267/m.309866 type:complete len:223 (-) Transcript_111267:1784-2452(-)